MIRTVIFAALFALGMGGFAVAADAPTDPQIAHIAYTAGQIDIAAAGQAIKKSKNQEIIDFANEMARDHKAVNDQTIALVTKLGVTPEDNPTSQALSKAAADKLAELGKLDGAAFDKAYIDNEVAYHKAVDSALSTLLIPSAKNAELKALLQTGLTLFTEHEKHAEMVAMKFNRGYEGQPDHALVRDGHADRRHPCGGAGGIRHRLHYRARQDAVRAGAGGGARWRYDHLAE
jgi:putative membrane protein